MNADVIVIGGGLVGSAIAYGLAGHDLCVAVIDGGDRDFRASSANFGLVWLHGKGLEMPAYQELTSGSVKAWPSFCAELTEITGIDLQYECKGGLTFCTNEAEYEQQRSTIRPIYESELLNRADLSKLLAGVTLGPAVIGAVFGHRDGHVNPLRLLSALHAGIVIKGGMLLGSRTVGAIERGAGGVFSVALPEGRVSAPSIVIAAGLGSKYLAAQVGLDVPVRPQRGQVLVTERLEPFLPYPARGLRQTQEGTVMIGSTREEVDFDNSTTTEAAVKMCANALLRVPALRNVKMVRQWSGLRVMTPDSAPIYAESESHPGAFVVVCHSGVTLAAGHSMQLAEAIAARSLKGSYDAFHHRRFDVSKAA